MKGIAIFVRVFLSAAPFSVLRSYTSASLLFSRVQSSVPATNCLRVFDSATVKSGNLDKSLGFQPLVANSGNGFVLSFTIATKSSGYRIGGAVA